MTDRIGIIGAGRTACAMAAYLSERGIKPVIWCRDPEKVRKISCQGLSITGEISGRYYPEATNDISRVTFASEYLFVMTTSNGHLPVAKLLAGNFQQNQRIVIFNGNWGACEFYSVLSSEMEQKKVVVGETGAMIFLADYLEDSVHIKKIKDKISVATIPSSGAELIVSELKDILPQLVPSNSVLSTSLNNSNPVIHAPVTLFNITRIENAEDFYFYRDGATRSVISYIETIDRERCMVGKAIGAEPQTCLEIINSFWPEKYDSLYDAIRKNEAYMTGKGPKTTKYRYLTEDIPYGISAIASIGKKYGLETPFSNALLKCYYVLFPELGKIGVDFSVIDLLNIAKL